GSGPINTVPSDGSTTATQVGSITDAVWVAWGAGSGIGTCTGTGTGTGTGSVTYSVSGPAGKVKSGPCVFTVKSSSAATGSVAFATAVVSGKNAPSPASGSGPL